MKICFLAGANSIHSFRWIKFFADKGHEIYWISLAPNIFSDINAVKFYQLREFSAKPLDILFNIIPVRRLIKKINPDILHAHYAGVNGVLGALSGFHPFLLTAWGSDVLIAAKSKITKPLIKFALDRADLITCNGEPLKDEIVRMGISPQKIRFIYWGIDIKKFEPKPKDKELRKALGIFESPLIVSLRNLEPVYNVETLINSVPLVLKNFPEAKFVIAGKGSKEADLKRLAEFLGVSGNIIFAGWISPDELPRYLASADVSVSTSLSDGGLSQGTGQAMACELPVITTDLKVNKDWIEDGENGLLFPIKDSKSLAEKIIMLLKDEKLRIKLGKEGRRTIEEKLNYHKEMEKVENLYIDLCKKNRI
ncbi:MAG: glycosyltransferase family 4 protein [Candidatus Portnoybacteria bacterium]